MSALVTEENNKVENTSTELSELKVSSENKYVVLCETSENNDDETESYYYFLKKNGNEKELEHLRKQLEVLGVVDGLSTFDLDLENTVSEQTAKEMTTIEINTLYHRKFDGKMKYVDLKLRSTDDDVERAEKCYEAIGDQGIENYVGGEDYEVEGDIEIVEDNSSEGDSEESDEGDVLFPVPSESSNNMLFPEKV